MHDKWTNEDQARAVAFRKEVAADMQKARRDGNIFAAWLFDKLTGFALWIERAGQRNLRM